MDEGGCAGMIKRELPNLYYAYNITHAWKTTNKDQNDIPNEN